MARSFLEFVIQHCCSEIRPVVANLPTLVALTSIPGSALNTKP